MESVDEDFQKYTDNTIFQLSFASQIQLVLTGHARQRIISVLTNFVVFRDLRVGGVARIFQEMAPIFFQHPDKPNLGGTKTFGSSHYKMHTSSFMSILVALHFIRILYDNVSVVVES